MIDDTLMRFEEKAVYRLRSLYRKYGYLPYKMSKFEEYDFYIRNKDFLISDRVISFNDTNGRLMALKPDVTLSIIKNGCDEEGVKQKVFYNENVYRISESTRRFKEIMQTGLECIGDVDIYDIYEVISLAAESLANISDSFCVEISNMDIVYQVVSSACGNPEFIRQALLCISEKNTHDLKNLYEKYSVDAGHFEKISLLISLYGDRAAVISQIENICGKELSGPLSLLSDLLNTSAFSDKIIFDFSVVNNMNYYNGFVFSGFISGINSGVLTGGQYDRLMEKMGRTAKAVGFAIYLDKLDELNYEKEKYDVDCLLIYKQDTKPAEIAETVEKLAASGVSVSAQKNIPAGLRYKELIRL